MGGELLVNILVIKKGVTPRYDLTDEELENAARVLFKASIALELGVPHNKPTTEDIIEYKERLRNAIERIKDAIADNIRDSTVLSGTNYNYLITGGMSWGDSPSETSEAIGDIVMAEIEELMGFESDMP